jgi:hypothetical protein
VVPLLGAGQREALDQFQAHLQQKKIISATDTVFGRNSLDRLAYLRDQIVHKAIEVPESECQYLVKDAQEFMEKYSLEIFKFNLLS